jgi:hypothetical protein
MPPPRPSLVRALLVAASCCWAEPALAQGTPEATSCRATQGSLSLIACRLVEQLGAAARGAQVSVLDVKSDRPLPNPDALRERLRGLVAGALGQGVERSKLRVELTVEKNGGVLRVSADLRRALGLWQRLRRDEARSEAHAFVEVPLDAELRTLIPPPPLIVGETLRVKLPDRGVVALACGPLGPDGGQELVVVSRSHVRVGRVQGRAFVERARAAWSALSPVAPSPLREPLASAEVTSAGTVRIGLSDRRDGLTLDRDLNVAERYEGLLPVPSGACVTRSGVGLAAEPAPCDRRVTESGPAASVSLDALAGARGYWLGRSLDTGWLVAGARGLNLPKGRVGAQLALGDADSDGSLELLFSADTLQAEKDRLTLVTLEGNQPITRFELPVPGISALTICQRQEGPRMAALAVAANDELWLLR